MTIKPNTGKELVLECLVKAKNVALGSEGLVPSVLVFVEFSQLSIINKPSSVRPTIQERSNTAEEACKDMETHTDRLKIRRAQKHTVLPACEILYQPGDKVSVWREKSFYSRTGE